MPWIKRTRLCAFLLAHALGLDVLWLYQIATCAIRYPGGCYPSCGPWDQLCHAIREGDSLVPLLNGFEFREAVVLLVFAMVLSIMLITTLWRIGRSCLVWRLRSLILAIAVLALEWPAGIRAWEWKDRWEHYRRKADYYGREVSIHEDPARQAELAAASAEWRSLVRAGVNPVDYPDPATTDKQNLRLHRAYVRGMWQPWLRVVAGPDCPNP